MFNDLINRVEDQLSEQLPLVVYRKPSSSKVTAILQNDDQLHIVKDYSESGFVFAPFDSSNDTILLHSDQLLIAAYKHDDNVVPTNDWSLDQDDTHRVLHLQLIQKGIDEIKKGKYKKVVLSRKLDVACKSSPISLFKKMLSLYSNAFCYLWYHPKIGLWLGATPEILLHHENNRLTTMSLAGTQEYTGEENPDWGHKEREEQQMVTSYITKALATDTSDLKISELQSVRAGNLWHLRTKITAKTKNNLGEIIELLHPTPAVCGMPMKTTKDFIVQNEDYQRAFFTGFLGELNFRSEIVRDRHGRNHENKAYKTIKNITELFVNLRCMQLRDQKALIYAGGGITKDSDPEKEWKETVSKSATMIRILAHE